MAEEKIETCNYSTLSTEGHIEVTEQNCIIVYLVVFLLWTVSGCHKFKNKIKTYNCILFTSFTMFGKTMADLKFYGHTTKKW